jgi:dTDP-4-dehydrorhamnose reductase
MGSRECNFVHPETIAGTVRAVAPDVIVNAAAYTAVDTAESEPELARLVNVTAPSILANEAKKAGAWLVHYSSDYVFDGTGTRPWQESDKPAPLNVYGVTKMEGERAIQSSGCHHLIFRASWIYAATGNNFIRTILRLVQERDTLSVVEDQVGSPTGADLIANITAVALLSAIHKPALGGIYHLAADGAVSWYAYARFILGCARQSGIKTKLEETSLLPTLSRDYATAAKRPHNSRLDTGKLKAALKIDLPEWSEGVGNVIEKIMRHNSTP